MFEVFFILTVIYVAYVVYGIYGVANDGEHSTEIKADAASIFKRPGKITVKAEVVVPITQQASPKKAKPTKVASPKPRVKKPSAPKIELRTVLMKNPATGEEAKIASNYRMVKRWVKEALVEEGLLEKIYKNNEMDDAAKTKVAEALSIIKAMDKYKV